MNEIKLLDKETIDKIAAGEVVDRPKSIVKELLENAIDAKADSISVEIKDGGTSLIRITDNGAGIEKEQISKAFLRHSTSKINDANDLSFIRTLGFRGEALSSIAAVSRVELCTKTKDSLTGTIFKIEGGEERSLEEAGLPDGTTIIVRDVFFNTPARLKFLKTPKTEASYVYDVIEKLALSHPEISFKFISNGSLKISTPGNGSLKDTIYSIYGKEISSNLYEINAEDEYVSINGFIGKPEIQRGNKNFEIYFINGRYIKDKVIEKAIGDVYSGFQMKGTFPFTVFNVIIEPELVDVNVHPSKMEIRFFDNMKIYDSVYAILSKEIRERQQIPLVKFDKPFKKEEVKRESVPEPFEVSRKENISELSGLSRIGNRSDENLSDTNLVGEIDKRNLNEANEISVKFINEETDYFAKNDNRAEADFCPDESEEKTFSENEYKSFSSKLTGNETFKQEELFNDEFLAKESRLKHKLIGEVFDTYWIVEFGESLYIIDQHAAHEKVLYEELLEKMDTGRNYSQAIYPPMIITVSQAEDNTLLKYHETFSKMGFEIEHFGGREYAIREIPVNLYGLKSSELFLSVLDELETLGNSNKPEILLDKLATASCKAAVKGGNRLSTLEANELIEKLLKLENPYNCPHGRPTIIEMTKYELEKKFKRII